uniref:hypothetical protein n=1 Tax=Pappia fissilis TaxID=1040649 RepID=UPI002A7FE38D|nr:hypothetical protein UYP79_mgp066 [Pappia fissilis]WOX61270.1 hypothetical protein [Pappia fissilis]
MSEANPLEFMIKISNLPIIPTNYNLIFKFIFLIIFILLSIYLLYQEFLYYDKLNSLHDGSIKQASFKLPQILRDLFLIISAGMGYRTYNRDEVSMPKFKKEEATKELEGTQAENAALNSENESLLDKYKRTLNEVNQKIDSQDRLKVMPMVDKEKEDLSNASNKSTNNLIEEEQPNLYPKVDQILENNINKKFENIGQIEKEFNEEEIKRSGILTYDFDLQKFLDTLSQEEKLAFSGLLLNSLILNYLISIILVLYGDYLIKRFDLENKYPKLAKFIKIRRQLQNYYLKVCFLWIFICIMPQICMYIFIIFPKIVEFIS